MLTPENPKPIAFRGTARFSADSANGKAVRYVTNAVKKRRRRPLRTASAYPVPASSPYPARFPSRWSAPRWT